jgi:hypothetical protein
MELKSVFYHFYPKQLMAQNIVIETYNVYLLCCVACLNIYGCCVYVLYCLLQTRLFVKTYTFKYSKKEFCMLLNSTGAKLWKNMGITFTQGAWDQGGENIWTWGEKMANEWRKLCNEELHNLYFLSNIEMIKSRRMSWLGHLT